RPHPIRYALHICGHDPSLHSFPTRRSSDLSALHKKSWAVIDRPYSLGCATVGALYERPRCIFCANPRGSPLTRHGCRNLADVRRSEEHTSELQSRGQLVCRPLPEQNTTNTL